MCGGVERTTQFVKSCRPPAQSALPPAPVLCPQTNPRLWSDSVVARPRGARQARSRALASNVVRAAGSRVARRRCMAHGSESCAGRTGAPARDTGAARPEVAPRSAGIRRPVAAWCSDRGLRVRQIERLTNHRRTGGERPQ